MGLGPALSSSNNIMKLILTLPLALISLRDWSQRTSGLASWQLSFPSRSRWPKIDWPVPSGRERQKGTEGEEGMKNQWAYHRQVIFIDCLKRTTSSVGFLKRLAQAFHRLLERRLSMDGYMLVEWLTDFTCDNTPWCLASRVAAESLCSRLTFLYPLSSHAHEA